MQRQLKVKDINLLEVYKKSKDVKVYAPWVKYAIPPLLITFVMGSIYGFICFQNYRMENEISDISAQLKKLQEDAVNGPNVSVYEEIETLKTNTKTYKDIYDNLATYPNLQTATFQAIDESAYGIAQISSFTYDREAQVITLQIEAYSADGTEMLVRRLKDTDVFLNVSYNGYSQTQKPTDPQESNTAGLSVDELLAYMNERNQTAQADNTNTVYNATVQCTLK